MERARGVRSFHPGVQGRWHHNIPLFKELLFKEVHGEDKGQWVQAALGEVLSCYRNVLQ